MVAGVVLIGEAAHAIDPEAGVGAGLGFGDALALAVAIAGDLDPDAACRNYEFWRRPVVAPYEAIGAAGARMVRGGERPDEERWPPGLIHKSFTTGSQESHPRASRPGLGSPRSRAGPPAPRSHRKEHQQMARGRRIALSLASAALALGSLAAAGCGRRRLQGSDTSGGGSADLSGDIRSTAPRPSAPSPRPPPRPSTPRTAA